MCWATVCDACSKHSIKVYETSSVPERVCDTCFKLSIGRKCSDICCCFINVCITSEAMLPFDNIIYLALIFLQYFVKDRACTLRMLPLLGTELVHLL